MPPMILHSLRIHKVRYKLPLTITEAVKMIDLKKKSLATVLLLLALDISAAELWTDLRIKFDVNAFNAFFHMGRTLSEVQTGNNFVLVNQTTCRGELDGGAYFYGYRVVDPQDDVLSLLYDVQGTVAGIQAWYPKDKVVVPESSFRFDQVWSYQNATVDGQEYFVSTVYFIPPELICTTGRNSSTLATEGTGLGMWIQQGATPEQSLEVAKDRTQSYAQGWSHNSCFPGMGRHNFFQVETYDETNCTRSEGFFLLFNRKEELVGFGFRIQGEIPSKYVEHPPNLAIQLILGAPVPQCVLDQNTLVKSTTMHVFFTSSPWTVNCITN